MKPEEKTLVITGQKAVTKRKPVNPLNRIIDSICAEGKAHCPKARCSCRCRWAGLRKDIY